MKIVLVEPGKEAREAEITGSLQEMQKLVDGTIRAMYPWEDLVPLVSNDEAKLIGMPFNRVLEDYDVIAGPFFICGIKGDHFCSLTEEQAKTYLEKFRQPELIYRNPVGISVFHCSEQDYAAMQKWMEEKRKPSRPKKENPER